MHRAASQPAVAVLSVSLSPEQLGGAAVVPGPGGGGSGRALAGAGGWGWSGGAGGAEVGPELEDGPDGSGGEAPSDRDAEGGQAPCLGPRGDVSGDRCRAGELFGQAGALLPSTLCPVPSLGWGDPLMRSALVQLWPGGGACPSRDGGSRGQQKGLAGPASCARAQTRGPSGRAPRLQPGAVVSRLNLQAHCSKMPKPVTHRSPHPFRCPAARGEGGLAPEQHAQKKA